MQIYIAIVAMLTCDGELECIATNQAGSAASIARDPHAGKGNTIVQQLYVAALAMIAHQTHGLIA